MSALRVWLRLTEHFHGKIRGTAPLWLSSFDGEGEVGKKCGEGEKSLKYCINFLIRSKGAYPEFGNNQDIYEYSV